MQVTLTPFQAQVVAAVLGHALEEAHDTYEQDYFTSVMGEEYLEGTPEFGPRNAELEAAASAALANIAQAQAS